MNPRVRVVDLQSQILLQIAGRLQSAFLACNRGPQICHVGKKTSLHLNQVFDSLYGLNRRYLVRSCLFTCAIHFAKQPLALSLCIRTLSVQFGYPNTRGRLDLFKIEDGKIRRIEGVSVFLPYYIRSLWND